MLDNVNNQSVSNSISFNSVAGTLVKSHPKSKFAKFNINRIESTTFFDQNNPHRQRYGHASECVGIVVLQTMLCGNDMVLVEFVDQKDFEDS